MLGCFIPLFPIDFIWKYLINSEKLYKKWIQHVFLILLQASSVKIVSDYTIFPELKSFAFSLQIRPFFQHTQQSLKN